MLNFWNGNKSLTRQQHELDVLRAVLQAQQLPYDIVHDATNYPLAANEANILRLAPISPPRLQATLSLPKAHI